MNRLDAEKLGLRNGDRVRLGSATNPEGHLIWETARFAMLKGSVKALEGLRPGVVAVLALWPLGLRLS